MADQTLDFGLSQWMPMIVTMLTTVMNMFIMIYMLKMLIEVLKTIKP